MLLDNEKVKLLYKYRPDNKHTLRSLEFQEFYFSFPYEFNDPFDSRVLVDCEGDEDDWSELAEFVGISTDARSKAMETLKSLDFDSQAIKKIYEGRQERFILVYCLSEIRDNILMWSHYSNSHHGICLGFETIIQENLLCIMRIDPNFNRHLDSAHNYFLNISKIEYQEHRPKPYDFFSNREIKSLFAFLTAKGIKWEYEKEHRIILPYKDKMRRIITFNKSSLKEVILGSKIDASYKKQVLDIIKRVYLDKGHHVEVFESQLDDQRYKVNIQNIIPMDDYRD